jgi:hypothetical protein
MEVWSAILSKEHKLYLKTICEGKYLDLAQIKQMDKKLCDLLSDPSIVMKTEANSSQYSLIRETRNKSRILVVKPLKNWSSVR